MDTKASLVGERLRNSFWFTPALMLAGTTVRAFLTVAIDDNADPEKVAWLKPIVYSGGPDGAREVLGVIAASMIGVAGVVFSITIVSLQLASGQFGPRMLANFVRDRGNQVTLGTFISAFLYSLLTLRTLRSDDPTSVPHLSVTVALAFAIAGLSVLVYYIHHVAVTIQAPTLIETITRDLRKAVDALFPDIDGVDEATEAHRQELPDGFHDDARRIWSGSTGYVDLIDLDRLVATAREHDLVLLLEQRPGRFVVPNSTVVHAWPSNRVSDDLADDIADLVITGPKRTVVQDVEFPIRQLVEIAVRSLSPGLNDPFTASTCVDQLSAGLCDLAQRRFPSPHIADEAGVLRVVIGDPVTWPRLVGGAFDQVRQTAKFHAQVYLHLLEALTRIAYCVEDERRLQPLLDEGRLVLEGARENLPAESDQDVVKERHAVLLAAVESRRA